MRVRHDGWRTSAWSGIDVGLHHIQKFINFVSGVFGWLNVSRFLASHRVSFWFGA